MRGDYFSADVQELVATFAKHGVRFMLVGGEAVIFHGYPRLTGDVDFWSFDEAWPRRMNETVDLADGRRPPLPVISLADLIRNKRVSGRHKDLDDVEHLEPFLSGPSG